MSSTKFLPCLLISGAVVLAAACGGDDMGPTGPVPSAISAVSGNAQTGTVGEALSNPLTVRVVDANGNGVSGVSVDFVTSDGSIAAAASLAASAGAGSAAAVLVSTDANGNASAVWTLGTAAGDQAATATVEGLTPVTFAATADAGPAASLSIASGDGQAAPTDQALDQALAVLVSDQFSNPVAGETVDFAVSSGSGTLSATSSTTDVKGLASTTLTVGSTQGPIQVTAMVTGLTPVAFDAAACVRQTDPTGDTFETNASAGLVIPDVVSICTWTDPSNLGVKMEFVEDVASDLLEPPNAVIGFLDLDTDQDAATGILSRVDVFRQDGQMTGMGMDYFVDMTACPFGASCRPEDADGIYLICDEFFVVSGSLVPIFSANTLTMMLPLSALGNDDGSLDLATILGTIQEPTDLAPNTGSYAFAAAPGVLARRSAARPPAHDPNDQRSWRGRE